MSNTSLSRQTYDRLKSELEDLTTRGRIEIAHAIEAARALGDLKENGDYHAAKDSQGKMEARIRQLQGLLTNATILEEGAHSTASTVVTGVVVHLLYEGDEESTAFLVGSIEEKHGGAVVVSPTSPLGKALLDRKVGDQVSYEAPGGKLQVKITKIGE